MLGYRQSWVFVLGVAVAGWVFTGCGDAPGTSPPVGDAVTAASDAGQVQVRAPVAPDGAGRARVIVGFTATPGRAEAALVRGLGGTVKYSYSIIPAIAATLPETALDGLRRNPNVTYIEGDTEVQATGWDRDEDELIWGADRVQADRVWGGGDGAVDIATDALTGAGVNVAILDTGIYHTHLDFTELANGASNYKGGFDFVNNDADPLDDNGHGTHCAGIVGAADNKNGIIQVAPRASLYGLKVLDAVGSGWTSDIVAALQWCIDQEPPMDVASMSFGSPFYNSSLETACNSAYEAGVLLVAAAGNSGRRNARFDTVEYPGRYDSVIAVAATDGPWNNDARALFSSTGPTVELAAPGVNIYSTIDSADGYATKSGTSMACPHVAGVAALVIERGVDTGPQAVRQRLVLTAEDLGESGRDTSYGYGLVNAQAATQSGETDNPPTITLTNPGDGATVSMAGLSAGTVRR